MTDQEAAQELGKQLERLALDTVDGIPAMTALLLPLVQDRARLDWLMPIFADDKDLGDAITVEIRVSLLTLAAADGLCGREAIDAAIDQERTK